MPEGYSYVRKVDEGIAELLGAQCTVEVRPVLAGVSLGLVAIKGLY